MEQLEKVLELIESYVGVSKIEKKLLGEVQTPAKLVNEMLDTIPVEFWSNPDAKVLEPSNGSGVFVSVAVQRFMKGLEKFEPDENLRYKHIIEKIIHVCELQPKNMFIYLQLFDPNNEYKMNWHRGSFLDEGFDNKMKEWGIDKFDLIIGNPPYQGTGRKKLHIEFLDKSIKKLLIDNGNLVFITPKIAIQYLLGHEVSQQKLNNLYVINTIKYEDINKYFNSVGSDFCYYRFINKIKTNEITKLENNEIELNYMMFLPYDIDLNVISILKKCLNGKNEMGRRAARINDNLSDEKNEIFKNKIVYKIKTNDIEYKYTNKLHKDMFKNKILLPTMGNNIIIDENAELFPGTSFVVYFVTENLLDSINMKKFIESKLYKYICNLYNTMRSPMDYVLKNIKKPIFENNFNDNELYKYFNLEENEIKLIEKQYEEY